MRGLHYTLPVLPDLFSHFKILKVGVVRPLAEVSPAKLSRRKTAARNYENVVTRDAATFFKGIGKGSRKTFPLPPARPPGFTIEAVESEQICGFGRFAR